MAARRNQPNVIKSNSFKLEKALSKNDLKRLVVKSSENALDKFVDDHQNQPVCLQFFYLDDSNLHITSSKLQVQGKFFQSEPKLIKAASLWGIENDQGCKSKKRGRKKEREGLALIKITSPTPHRS